MLILIYSAQLTGVFLLLLFIIFLEPPTICIKKVGRRGRPPKKDGKMRGKQGISDFFL